MQPAELYAYHRWANGRLFDVAATLGEEACARDVGKQFSFPTLTRMFAHIYGADAVWLARWKGTSLTGLPGAEIPSLAVLRGRWAALTVEQRAFVDALRPEDLERVIEYTATDGRSHRTPLSVLVEHVAAHAVHHRSEIATMLTMISGAPPESSIISWHRATIGEAS